MSTNTPNVATRTARYILGVPPELIPLVLLVLVEDGKVEAVAEKGATVDMGMKDGA